VTLAALAIVAAVPRTAWAHRGAWTDGDAEEYLLLARSIVSSGRFSYDGVSLSSYRPPLYPGLLAAAMRLSSHPIEVVLALQCMLGVLTVVLTHELARRVFNQRVALISGTLLALAPMTSRYVATALTETLFTFLMVLAMWAWQERAKAIAGVGLGLAVLTRASLLPYIVVILALAAIPAFRRQRRTMLTIGVVAVVTIAPWVIRNVYATGRVTVADAGWGANLLYGTVDLPRGANPWTQILSATADLNLPHEPTAAAEHAARDAALERIRANPIGWGLTRLRQFPRLLLDSGDYFPLQANTRSFREALSTQHWDTVVLKIGFMAGNAILFLLAAYGLWLQRGRLQDIAPLWTFPVFLLVVQLPMYAEPRYGMPLVPFFAILAAAAVDAQWAAGQPPMTAPDRSG